MFKEKSNTHNKYKKRKIKNFLCFLSQKLLFKNKTTQKINKLIIPVLIKNN